MKFNSPMSRSFLQLFIVEPTSPAKPPIPSEISREKAYKGGDPAKNEFHPNWEKMVVFVKNIENIHFLQRK